MFTIWLNFSVQISLRPVYYSTKETGCFMKSKFLKLTSMLMVVFLTAGAFGFRTNADDDKESTYYYQWNNATDEERYELPVEVKAWAVGLSVNEFTLFSKVVESEAYRGEDLTDRILVACVIINRYNDGRFGRSITGVLTRPGQFATVSLNEETGRYVTIANRTNASDWAIIEAYRIIASDEVPSDMLYFNSINFDRSRYDFAFGGGNYFSCENPIDPRYLDCFLGAEDDSIEEHPVTCLIIYR